MIIIGITGTSGAGKSTALGVLAEMGACIIDCDVVYHALLEAGGTMLEELNQRFPAVVTEGKLCRKALGEIVFHNAAALSDLNAITHGYVRREAERRIQDYAKQGENLVAIEAIALLESGIGAMCTTVVGVIAPVALRAKRLMAREGMSFVYVMARIKSQKPDSFFRERCDYLLENHAANPEAFADTCRALFRRIVLQ